MIGRILFTFLRTDTASGVTDARWREVTRRGSDVLVHFGRLIDCAGVMCEREEEGRIDGSFESIYSSTWIKSHNPPPPLPRAG